MLLAFAAPAHPQPASQWSAEEIAAIARHGPWPPPAPARDPSNRVSGDPAAIALGEHLFGDARLSADGAMSCATCHEHGRNWSDGRARAMGRVELDRRTPSLWNVGFGHWFGWDGAGDSLWAQSIRPLLDPREMAADAARVAAAGARRRRARLRLRAGVRREARRRRRKGARGHGQGAGGFPRDAGQPAHRLRFLPRRGGRAEAGGGGALSRSPPGAA